MNNEIFSYFNEKLIERYGIDVTMSRSRQQPRPTMRRALVNVMYRLYGYHDEYISKLLNLDRSTILDHRHKHDQDLRHYPLYTEIYEFLESASQEKTSFIDMAEVFDNIKSLRDEG
jgi:hypothetical protein